MNHQATTTDYLIMRARTFAQSRGALPAEIQRSVAKFDSDAFPIPVRLGIRHIVAGCTKPIAA